MDDMMGRPQGPQGPGLGQLARHGYISISIIDIPFIFLRYACIRMRIHHGST